MYTPLHTPLFGSAPIVISVSAASLHEFLGFSWKVLLPYTFVGIGLMIYSQSRLFIGQRQLKKLSSEDSQDNK